ncbi:DUF6719 family protein [Rhizobium sp. Root1220]|uniref:DUF6719 family protein n=1 Tax=Rhizobium sp. Root1220 TaxID=1736432 RepID=UPI0006FB36F6|nr:DUF6719 family protein [Rhizobium sp. Root1220]KQV66236.1 hypothetical protein ASC90_13685 [Rhizobium sp. Root1220]
MARAIAILVSAAFLCVAFDIPSAGAATKVVTAPPSLSTLAPGESVFYNDKKCPAGMIAKFTKAQRRSQMKRECVRQ